MWETIHEQRQKTYRKLLQKLFSYVDDYIGDDVEDDGLIGGINLITISLI